MSEPNGDNIRVVPIGDLLPDVANVRRRDERAKSTLRASVRQFGPARSIVVDAKGIVRAGNGTLEAAQAEGCDEVLIVRPRTGQLVAVERDDWSPTEAVAYSVADNHIGDMATDDPVGLAEVLRSLQSEGFDLDSIGFTGEEVDQLCIGLGDALIDDATPPDDFPEKDESIETEHACPKCGYRWSGGE